MKRAATAPKRRGHYVHVTVPYDECACRSLRAVVKHTIVLGRETTCEIQVDTATPRREPPKKLPVPLLHRYRRDENNADEANEPAPEESEFRLRIAQALNAGVPLPIRDVSESELAHLLDHFNSGESTQQQAKLYKGMGRFLHTFATADVLLGVALAMALNPENPSPASRITTALTPSQKLVQLRRVLPDKTHFKSMLDHASTLNDRRNYVAHGNILTHRFDDSGKLEWGLWLEKNNKHLPVSPTTLKEWHHEARALCGSLEATVATLLPRVTFAAELEESFGALTLFISTKVNEWLPQKKWAIALLEDWYGELFPTTDGEAEASAPA